MISCDSFFEQDRANLIRTGSPLEIRTNSAFIEGLLLDVSEKDEEEILAYGHVWAQNINPTTDDFSTDFRQSNRPNTFLSFLSGLESEVPYYVRAYLITPEGTFYGEEIQITPGQLYTTVVVDISTNQAFAEGFISPLANNVQRFGHCWATHNLPTLSDNSAEGDLSGEGFYFTTLDNLQAGTRYYVRAFMINSDGFLSYGEEIIFETDNQ